MTSETLKSEAMVLSLAARPVSEVTWAKHPPPTHPDSHKAGSHLMTHNTWYPYRTDKIVSFILGR